MPDLLVPLYNLPPEGEKLAALRESGIVIRRAFSFELSPTRRFIITHFSEGWADEAQAGFARSPISTFLAVHEKRIVGFASVDATAKGFFGPTGVDPAHRKKGIGAALLLAALHDLKNQGYGYGIIGSAGPVDFYVNAVGAIVIPNSSPGIYRDMLGLDGAEPAKI